jgi:hypothetical protein
VTAPLVERVAADLPDVYTRWHWWHGQPVAKNLTDDDLRDAHVAEFPLTGGLYEGFAVGGRP